jgi:hypothetical protein
MGTGPESPPTIRLDLARAQFLPKGTSLIFNGTDPDIKRYQLSLQSEKTLGCVGVKIRDWLSAHDGVGGCFVESRRLLIGVRFRSNPAYDAEVATYDLLDELQRFLIHEVYESGDIEFSPPQMLLYGEILSPTSSTS